MWGHVLCANPMVVSVSDGQDADPTDHRKPCFGRVVNIAPPDLIAGKRQRLSDAIRSLPPRSHQRLRLEAEARMMVNLILASK